MSVEGRRKFPTRGAGAVALVVGLTAVVALAYVPTCEQQLAAAYPKALRADLSACDGAEFVEAESPVDRARFATRLNGTWALKNWTVHGVTGPELPRSARLYFDVAASGGSVEGSALFIERGVGGLVPVAAGGGAERTLAFWTIGIGQEEKRLVTLVMKGDPRSSVRSVDPQLSNATRFSALADVFVGIDAGAVSSRAWDRIVMSQGSLSYVSCQRGIVQRYTKISDEQPLVEGLTLAAYWERLKGSRRLAAGPGPIGSDPLEGSRPASAGCCAR